MLNRVWAGMMIVSFLCSFVTGKTASLAQAAASGAEQAVKLLLAMLGVMCLWTGMMRIADQSGLTKGIAGILSGVLSKLMPDYDKNDPVFRYVSANLTANFLGLGNAATPLGLQAMKEMQKKNLHSDVPNQSMVMFVVLNTASIQLIPTTIAALRQAYGSAQPYEVLPYIWIVSAGAVAVGILAVKILPLFRKRRVR